jgi:hypothetical protein
VLNKEVSSRFQDWLLNPSEGLDFEVKSWLDLKEPEAIGAIVKALIALENHGGGFLLIGYKEVAGRHVPDEARPESLEAYSTDAINALLRRAEPTFHVEVTIQQHPTTGEGYPLVRVSGNSTVPVRSASATPKGTLKERVYYVRAPGPASREPTSAAEWDRLIRRVVLNQREEIIKVLRDFLPQIGASLSPHPAPEEKLEEFARESEALWTLLNDSLGIDHPAHIKLGHFELSARIIGTSKNLSLAEIKSANESARRYTGWPIFVDMGGEARAKSVNGNIQAWIGAYQNVDVASADFWRISPDGFFYLLRGYEEDARLPAPGTVLDALVPIWRVGEFLLRVSELGGVMFEDGFELVVRCKWTGLKGRNLRYVFGSRGQGYFGLRRVSEQEEVVTTARFPSNIAEILPEAVERLTKDLYESFDFATIRRPVVAEELAEMAGKSF